MFKKITYATALAACAISTSAFAEAGSVDAIVQMAKAGLGDDAVIAKINADGKSFDLSTDQMISLRQQGVSSAVIAAMVGAGKAKAPEMSLTSPDPRVPHPAGLYLLQTGGVGAKMQRLDPTASSQAKTGGILGYAFTGGIASMSVKVAIANENARYQAGSMPRFFMFLGESNNAANGSAWASGVNASINSPAELTLVRLQPKKGRREARVGSVNIAGAKSGVMDKDRLSFTHDMVRPGVYQIDVTSALEPGEYGFIYSLGGAGTNGAMTAKIFDFAVR